MKDIERLLPRLGITLLPFQRKALEAFRAGRSGLINAPTGGGKTFAVALPFLESTGGSGTRMLWITPLRALARDTTSALHKLINELDLPFTAGMRTGDTSQRERRALEKSPPTILVTTPESLHLMLSQAAGYPRLSQLTHIVVDEWHELLTSKRGTLVELGIAALRSISPEIKVWGLSATLADLHSAARILTGVNTEPEVIKAEDTKQVTMTPLLPEKFSRFSWAGHLGTRLKHLVLPVIHQHDSVLLFTNTRGQTERWYLELVEADPSLNGYMAVHHGSLDAGVRRWIEDSIHRGELRVVVCTSSLDLGVDFAPVDAVIQVGSPKGVGRFLQRAGRSGHAPGKTSSLYFVPTNAWEVFEMSALRSGAEARTIESSPRIRKPLDVLIQYLVTRACGGGFEPAELLQEVRSTDAYQDLSDKEWNWCLEQVTTGGRTLWAYDEYKKVTVADDRYQVTDRRTALRHRLSIGTIMSDPMLTVKYLRGGFIGSVEERFVARLKPGEVFWLGGKRLSFVRLKDMTVYVRKANQGAGSVPRWLGGRLSLSAEHAARLRETLANPERHLLPVELNSVQPLLDLQRRWSRLPSADELLAEQIESREGFHLFLYPFEGRTVHEGLAVLLATRLSRQSPQTFSLAMNDYGLEILSDRPFTISSALLSPENVEADLLASLDMSELSRRHFKEIARVAGLTFTGYPAKQKSDKQLLVSASLLFDVFTRHEPDHLLLQQARDEVMARNLQRERVVATLTRLSESRLVQTFPGRFTPLSFPLVVDRLREKVSSEKLEQRVERMIQQLEKAADRPTGPRSEARNSTAHPV